MLENRYDVVIVGAGPAGAAAAQAMRGHGLEAVIIEKASLPRYKMCSGILFPSAAEGRRRRSWSSSAGMK